MEIQIILDIQAKMIKKIGYTFILAACQKCLCLSKVVLKHVIT